MAGRADPGSLVTLEVDGLARGTAPSEPGFRPAGVRFVYADGGDLALSPDGKRAVWIQYVDALSIQELGSSEVRFLRHGGSAGAWHPVFSPDGGTVLLSRRQSIAPYEYDLVLVRLAGGPVRVLASGRPVDYAWSADGSRLAVSFYESQGSSLHVVDVATGASVELGRSAGIDAYPRWSPDGTRLALVRSWGTVTELRVLELSSSRDRVLDSEAENGALSWSPDGTRLAWTARSDEVRLVRVEDLATGQREEIAETGSDALDPRFSPQGDWLSFIRIQRLPEGWTMGSLRAAHRQGLRVTVTQLQSGYWSPEAHEWLAGQLAVREQERLSLFSPEAGRFVVREVPLAPGENRLVARALDPATDLESADSETVVVTVPGDAFPDLAAFPEGIGSASPRAGRGAGRPAARPGRERRGQRRVRGGGPRTRDRPGGRGRPRHAGHAAARAGRRRGLAPRALDSGRARPLHGPGRGRSGRPCRGVLRGQQRRRAHGARPRRGGLSRRR